MSGTKEFMLIDGAVALASLTGKALHAYHKRQQHIREAAIRAELTTQQRVAQIQQQHIQRTVVIIPSSTPTGATATSSEAQIKALQSKLPQITAEYDELVEQQLLDPQTVNQALELVKRALDTQDLSTAETNLQALDDARIIAMQSRRSEKAAQVEYLQTRLQSLLPRIPKHIAESVSQQITSYHNNWIQHSNSNLQQIHTYLNDLEAQVDEIQIAADNLIDSWLEVGYDAQITAIDDGDIVIQVATHDCANTEMRVQFSGQKIDLFAQSEEPELCTDRTFAALRVFQQQGYQLEWTRWDGNFIPSEWRNLYSNIPQNQNNQSQLWRRQAQEY